MLTSPRWRRRRHSSTSWPRPCRSALHPIDQLCCPLPGIRRLLRRCSTASSNESDATARSGGHARVRAAISRDRSASGVIDSRIRDGEGVVLPAVFALLRRARRAHSVSACKERYRNRAQYGCTRAELEGFSPAARSQTPLEMHGSPIVLTLPRCGGLACVARSYVGSSAEATPGCALLVEISDESLLESPIRAPLWISVTLVTRNRATGPPVGTTAPARCLAGNCVVCGVVFKASRPTQGAVPDGAGSSCREPDALPIAYRLTVAEEALAAAEKVIKHASWLLPIFDGLPNRVVPRWCRDARQSASRASAARWWVYREGRSHQRRRMR